VGKAAFRPILWAVMALAAGLPAYLAIAHFGLWSPALRDRPWPLEALVALCVVATARTALRASGTRSRRLALAASALAGVSLVTLVVAAHVVLQEIPAAAKEVAVGQALPSLSLSDDHGAPVAFGPAAGHGQPTVILFYRGGWCPSCRSQLVKLAHEAGPFLAAGVRVLGISPDPPEVSAKWKRELGVGFPLLTDEDQRLAQDLCGARAHCLLVVDGAGVVRWGALRDNWRADVRPGAVLQAAYRLR
jgi:peroxiredoxin